MQLFMPLTCFKNTLFPSKVGPAAKNADCEKQRNFRAPSISGNVIKGARGTIIIHGPPPNGVRMVEVLQTLVT